MRQSGTAGLDLADAQEAARIDPFTTGAVGGAVGAGPRFPEPEMAQQGGYGGGYANVAPSMRSTSPPGSAYDPYNQSFTGLAPGQYVGQQYPGGYAPGPHGPSPPPTTSAGSSTPSEPLANPYSVSGSSSAGRSTKERERLRLANAAPEEEHEGGPVVQHRDGGRVNNEIPPSYDSIPRDQ
jgi:hypothetical protein